MADRDVRLEMELELVKDALGRAVEILIGDETEAARLAAEKDVLGNRELRDQRELLVYHGDPCLLRPTDAGEMPARSIDQNLSDVCTVRIDAAENLDQRRFAGAIL